MEMREKNMTDSQSRIQGLCDNFFLCVACFSWLGAKSVSVRNLQITSTVDQFDLNYLHSTSVPPQQVV